VKENTEFVILAVHDANHLCRGWPHHPELSRRHQSFCDAVAVCNMKAVVAHGTACYPFVIC